MLGFGDEWRGKRQRLTSNGKTGISSGDRDYEARYWDEWQISSGLAAERDRSWQRQHADMDEQRLAHVFTFTSTMCLHLMYIVIWHFKVLLPVVPFPQWNCSSSPLDDLSSVWCTSVQFYIPLFFLVEFLEHQSTVVFTAQLVKQLKKHSSILYVRLCTRLHHIFNIVAYTSK